MKPVIHKRLRRGSRQSGFTLMELMISVAILGILMAMLAPMVSWAMTFIDAANRNEVTLNNRRLAEGMTQFARNDNNGRLPAAVTNGGVAYSLYDPSSSTPESPGALLSEALRNTGVPVEEILNDRSILENRRVYQVVRDLTYQERLFFNTGPLMNLRYDMGVIYMTELGRGDTSTESQPGASAVMTASNYLSWEPEYPDYGAIAFSSLPLQKDMLRMTVGKLNRLTDRMQSEYHARLRAAAANTSDNLFPQNTHPSGFPMVHPDPTVNMGCRDGWYNLAAPNVNILEQIGLNKEEYSETAWGGTIEYCRSYDPLDVGATKPPYYAAIRINRNVSNDTAPTLINDAAIITF